MTKSGYPYPPDEFDVAVPGGAPVGVHRAPRSGWSSAWPFLLVAVVCAAVAWGGITLLSGGDDPAEAQGDPSPSVSASASASGSAPETSASPSTSPSAETPELSVEQLVAAMDPAASYVVFNTGATVAQLAATSQASLEAAGVANIDISAEPAPEGVDNSSVTANTVWYGEGREAEAKAIAAVLGIPASNVVMNEAVSGSPQAAWVFMFTAPTG